METDTATSEQRFLENVTKALGDAQRRGFPAIILVRRMDAGVSKEMLQALAGALPQQGWKYVDVSTKAGWKALCALAASGGPHRLIVLGLPRDGNGTPTGATVKHLASLHSLFLHASGQTIFVLTPDETDLMMNHAERIWTGRTAFLAWPRRSQPLPAPPQESRPPGAERAAAQDGERPFDAPATPRQPAPPAPPERPSSFLRPSTRPPTPATPPPEPASFQRRTARPRVPTQEIAALETRLPGTFPSANGPARVDLAAQDPTRLLAMAVNLIQSGDLHRASDCAVYAMNGFSTVQDEHGMAEAEHLLGLIARRNSDPRSAEEWLDKAVVHYRRSGRSGTEHAMASEVLGELRQAAGEPAQALSAFREALEVDERVGNDSRVAAGLRRLALVLEQMGDLERAGDFLKRSVALEEKLRNPAGLARCYLQTSRLQRRKGMFVDAESAIIKAEEVLRKLGDKPGLSAVHHERGNLYLDQEFFAEAVRSYKRALALDTELGDRRGAARTRLQISLTLQKAENPADALRHLLLAHADAPVLGRALGRQVAVRISELRREVDDATYKRILEEVESARTEGVGFRSMQRASARGMPTQPTIP